MNNQNDGRSDIEGIWGTPLIIRPLPIISIMQILNNINGHDDIITESMDK